MFAAAAKRTALAAATLVALTALTTVGSAGGAPKSRDRVAPTAPQAVSVADATQSTISLTWAPAVDDVEVAGYYVYGELGRARVSGTSYRVDRLECGQSTGFTVVAFDRARNRSERAAVIASTLPCSDGLPPSPPSGFRQAATTQTSVVLEWNASADNVGVVRYGVYRNQLSVGSPVEPNLALAGLTCGTTVGYQVDAVDAAGNRSARAPVWVRTAECADGQAPSAPTGLAVTASTATSVSLAWNESTDNVGVAGYRVGVDGAPVVSGPSRTATVPGLACGKRFTFTVDAADAAGNRSPAAQVDGSTGACPSPSPSPVPSGWTLCAIEGQLCSFTSSKEVRYGANGIYTAPRTFSAPVSCTDAIFGDPIPSASKQCEYREPSSTPPPPIPPVPPVPPTTPPPGDTSPPSQPSGLRVTGATGVSVSLAWTPSTDNVAVTGYDVFADGSKRATVSLPGASVPSLSCGRGYSFAVEAVDAAGNRSARSTVTASTAPCADTQAPSAPAGVATTTRTATSIALGWSGSTDNVGVIGYGLYRGGVLQGTSAGTTGIFSGLACNTNYTLAVDAYDAAGNRSGKTTVMVATTGCPDTTPPASPTGLAVSNVTQTSLRVAWNASGDNVGVTGYDVYRNSAKIGTVSSTSYDQTGLACGTSYTIAVVARDAAGNSSTQASVTAATAACPPPPAPAPAPTPPPSPAPTPPPSTGTVLDQISDFSGWGNLHPEKISEVSTPHGPGFRFLADFPGGSGNGVQIVDTDHLVDRDSYLGTVSDFSGKFMFPSSGNPSGFPLYGDWNCLWEYGPGHTWNNQIGVDWYSRKIYVRSYKAGAPDSRQKALAPNQIQFDHWYDFRWQVKWSSGSDGYVKFVLDGVTVADWTGPTQPSGNEAPWIQFGFYSADVVRNEVLFAGLRKA